MLNHLLSDDLAITDRVDSPLPRVDTLAQRGRTERVTRRRCEDAVPRTRRYMLWEFGRYEKVTVSTRPIEPPLRTRTWKTPKTWPVPPFVLPAANQGRAAVVVSAKRAGASEYVQAGEVDETFRLQGRGQPCGGTGVVMVLLAVCVAMFVGLLIYVESTAGTQQLLQQQLVPGPHAARTQLVPQLI